MNNHLEPAHDAAVRAAIDGLAEGRGSVACPLTRRWARTLSRRVQARQLPRRAATRRRSSSPRASGVRDAHGDLPPVGLSLSDAIRAGKATFREMGMDRAYTGAPAEATREEGDELYARLVAMIVTEVTEGLAKRGPA